MQLSPFHNFLRYNIISEYAALLMAILILFFMMLTKPRRTHAFKYLFYGTLASIFAILTQIAIVQISSNLDLYDRTLFTGLLVLFLALYALVLMNIFNYIYLMSERKVEKRYIVVALYVIIPITYVAGVIYHVYMKYFFYVRTDGIDIIYFTRFYCIAGMTCVLCCFFYTVYRRKYISRIVRRAIALIIPLEILLLTMQCFDRDTIFSSVTYVLPLVASYLLFHSNPYDEDTGAQNTSAMESRLMSNNRRGKIFYLGYIEFPQLMGNSRNLDFQGVKLGLAKACRHIERISNNIHIYRINYGTFAVMMETKEKSDAENYAEQIRDVLDVFYHENDHLHYFFGVGGDSKRFNEYGNKWTQFFIRYIKEKYSIDGQNVYYFACADDFRDYNEIFIIEQTLADIRAKMNPEDERIMCYAQPIYSVKKNSFRTAEALMRMSIDGKMVPPDQFISIAEKSNCIHALTVIMMHKVCRAVEKLAEECDFDAVTINCSTSDFVDREFYKEIMDIIHSYHVDQKKIRLELTESMMAESYDAVKHNMNMLNMEGIQLYMDDFGTGYSNLERVLDVPVQTIKFDKSLLYKSIQDERVGDIISYMIDIFKKNGFITLVEGVEDESQKKYSIDRGFDYIQGYHYAKPMPIDNLSKYFNKK